MPSVSYQSSIIDCLTTPENIYKYKAGNSQVGATKKRLADELTGKGINHDRTVANFIEKTGHIE